jgi:hypothetical protein
MCATQPTPWRLLQATERQFGTVKWFNSTKGAQARPAHCRVNNLQVPSSAHLLPLLPAGYGFITSEDCEDEVFVHQVR